MQNKLSKKFIKNTFRKPNKARCRNCGNKLFLLPTNESLGKILFKCISSQCGNVIDLTEYKGKYTLNKFNLDKIKTPVNSDDLSKLSLKLTHYRIKDKYYQINNDTTYNPITRMKNVGIVYTKIENDDHKTYLKIIIDLLKNAQN